MLNGAEGLSQVASGLVAQGKAIFDALRGGGIDYEYEDNAPPPESGTSHQGSR